MRAFEDGGEYAEILPAAGDKCPDCGSRLAPERCGGLLGSVSPVLGPVGR